MTERDRSRLNRSYRTGEPMLAAPDSDSCLEHATPTATDSEASGAADPCASALAWRSIRPSLSRTPRRSLGMFRVILLTFVVLLGTIGASRVLAQGNAPSSAPGAAPAPATVPSATVPPAPGAAPEGAGGKISLMSLFKESFDLFTVLLIAGSLAGWTIIFMVVLEVRANNIVPEESEKSIISCIKGQRWAELRQFTQEDDALVSKALRAAINVPVDDKDAVRDAAEMAASEESARWFRKVEPLNVLGNLGPLLGLAGTVWGMILAFAALQSSQGQASPATLSGGIAKALFHTLLGLLLAVPCLTIYGFYRSYVDRLCTRAMVVAGEMVELLPREARVRMGLLGSNVPPAPRPAVPAAMPPASPGTGAAR